jgi:ATP-dependent RNA helicase DeaD
VLQFISRRQSLEKVETFLRSAGFGQATPLQKEYVPSALKGRDLIVEAMSGEGKTIAQLLPFFLRPRGRRKSPAGLILVHSLEEAKKYEVEFNRLSDTRAEKNTIAVLGKNPTAGSDLQLLTKYPDIIVGTTERIIDHIRRNNIPFGSDLSVVVNIPDEAKHGEFNFDVEFIFTKLSSGVQKLIFTPSIEAAVKLNPLLKRPLLINSVDHRMGMPPLHVYRYDERSPEALMKLVLARDFKKLLILSDSNEKTEELSRRFSDQGVSCRRIVPELAEAPGENDACECYLAAFGDVQHIPLPYHSILLYGPPPEAAFFQRVGRAVSGRSPAPVFAILLDRRESEFFSMLQENSEMTIKEEKFPQDSEVLKGRLRQIMKLIKEEEDPELLNNYRKLIRKNVPLHLRGYLTAYLFKLNAGASGALGAEKPAVAAGPMQTLFLSIGKNRKVFPRDLVKLFKKQLGLEQNEIGTIKVLDNYSFVDVPTHAARKAIESMNGIEFHGRPITVNFARKKKSEADGES